MEAKDWTGIFRHITNLLSSLKNEQVIINADKKFYFISMEYF